LRIKKSEAFKLKRNTTLIIAANLLVLPGIYLVYPGTEGKIWPPTITDIGFMIIAIAFLGLRNK